MEPMMEMWLEKANVLIEALPYIQRFHGKTIVVKIWWKCNGRS